MGMYKISHKRSSIEQRLRTNYQKINYNRFRWWRWYQDKNSPLPYKSEFRDKIFNGDFDPSGYIWQAMLCEHMLNDMQSKTSDGQLDHTSTEVQLMKVRRKKLLEDHEKDENGKLESLWAHFVKHFNVTKEQAQEEALECCGSLIDLYYIIEDKYPKYNIIRSKRGRPKKVI